MSWWGSTACTTINYNTICAPTFPLRSHCPKLPFSRLANKAEIGHHGPPIDKPSKPRKPPLRSPIFFRVDTCRPSTPVPTFALAFEVQLLRKFTKTLRRPHFFRRNVKRMLTLRKGQDLTFYPKHTVFRFLNSKPRFGFVS